MEQQELTPRQVIVREVRAWMSRVGMKQTDLANLLGISQASTSKKLNATSAFTFEELLAVAGYMDISLGELLGEGILNAKIPNAGVLVGSGGKQKNAPIGFIPTGASYEVVASTAPVLAGVGPAGLEPATKGLSDPAYRKVARAVLLFQKFYSHAQAQSPSKQEA